MTFMPGVLSSRRCRIGHFWRTIISLEPLKYTTSERHLSSIIIGEDGSCHVYNLGLIFHRRLRVPKYGAILEFLSFVVLMLTFCLCLARKLCSISLLSAECLCASRTKYRPLRFLGRGFHRICIGVPLGRVCSGS